MSKTNQCRNCEKHFEDSFDYCPYCGQEVADKLTFGVLFSNTISNYFSIDARFFRSFIPLMTRPGVIARKFVDGKRLSYLHPAQFYLFISVVFFFMFSFSVRKADSAFTETLKKGFDKDFVIDSLNLKKDSIKTQLTTDLLNDSIIKTKLSDKNLKLLDSLVKSREINDGLSIDFDRESLSDLDSIINSEQKGPNVSFDFDRKKLDSLIENNGTQEQKLEAMGLDDDSGTFTRKFYTQMLKFYEKQGVGIIKTLYDTIPITMFLMLPLFSFLLKIFYWKRGTFAHHMVFSFYYFTFMFTTFCILILLDWIVDIPLALELLVYFSFIIYLAIAFRNFYKSSWIGAILKANIVSFIYMMFIVPIAMFGVIMVSFMLY